MASGRSTCVRLAASAASEPYPRSAFHRPHGCVVGLNWIRAPQTCTTAAHQQAARARVPSSLLEADVSWSSSIISRDQPRVGTMDIVHDWPGRAVDEIPSPALVAAWLALDMVPTEKIPRWAAF